jgi:uncharacterized membrane protein YidH (DUF202 family)
VSGAAPGVQNERTALAWQRTALSLMAGSAIVSRLTFERLGAVSLASVLLALPLALWVFLESRRRYRGEAVGRPSPGHRGGRATAALSAAIVVIAVTELAAMVT